MQLYNATRGKPWYTSYGHALLLSNLGFHLFPKIKNLSVIEAFFDIKDKLTLPFSMEIIILAPWSIWIISNNKIFEDQTLIVQRWKVIFKHELKMVAYRMKKKHAATFKGWLQSQV
jgi:hypothetical protein